MKPDLRLVYRFLRTAAIREDLVLNTALSERYKQHTGHWVDPHLGWGLPLADIDRRCAALWRTDHRPILSAIVVTEGDQRPGLWFSRIGDADGDLATPANATEEAWLTTVEAVFRQAWPEELEDLQELEGLPAA